MDKVDKARLNAMAHDAAEAMAELGSCGIGTWQERKAALMAEGKSCDSGFDEVVGWLASEE